METLFSKTFDERIMNLNTLIDMARCIMHENPDASKEILNRATILLTCDASQLNRAYDDISNFIVSDIFDLVSPYFNELLIRNDPDYINNFCVILRDFCEWYIKLMHDRKCNIRSLELKLRECVTYLSISDIATPDLLTHIRNIQKCVYHAKNAARYSTRKPSYDFLVNMYERLDQFKSQLDEYIKIMKVEGDNNA